MGSVESDAGTLYVIAGIGKRNVVAVESIGWIMLFMIVLDLDWTRWFLSEHHIKDLGEWLQEQNVRVEMDTDGFWDCVGVQLEKLIGSTAPVLLNSLPESRCLYGTDING